MYSRGLMAAISTAPESSPTKSPKLRPRVALRTALTLFIVLSVLATALLIHLSWSYTARQNVADVAAQLNTQIANSISAKLSDIKGNAMATQGAVRSIFLQGAIAPED